MRLLPSLRLKKRYVLFEILSSEQFSLAEVKKAVDEALLLFLGQWGVAKASPLLISEKYKNNHFILKVHHTAVDEVKSAVILIKSIKNVPVMIRSRRTSGTLKKLHEV